MADVFISYRRDNAARVEPIVRALEAHGLSVWWDRALEHNADFGQVIAREIDGSKAVIVCWMKACMILLILCRQMPKVCHLPTIVFIVLSSPLVYAMLPIKMKRDGRCSGSVSLVAKSWCLNSPPPPYLA